MDAFHQENQRGEGGMWLLGFKDMPRYVRHRRAWPQVDVYATDVDSHADHLQMFEASLSGHEREQARRLRHVGQRKRVTITRGLFRHVIAAYLGTRAADVPLERDKLGKPAVRDLDHSVQLQVSCSRSGSTAVFVVGNVEPVGVDVELVAPEKFGDELVDDILTEREHRLYAFVPESQRPRWLAQAWVCKEAILKALGCGLDVNPTAVEAASTTENALPDWLPVPHGSGWLIHERQWKSNLIALAMRTHACSVRWAELAPGF